MIEENSMDDTDRQAPLVKCRLCSKPMAEVLVCDYCHSLNPDAATMDHFTLLGLPRQFDLDEETIRAKFLALNREAHPDFHMDQSDEVQLLAMQMSSAINNAYRTLREPASRAAYMLELLGGKSSAADKSVPDGFLDTMMMMQEELADAKAGGNTAAVARLRGVLTNQRDGLIGCIAELFDRYDKAVGCEGIRRDVLDEIRRQLNAISYVRKLLSQAS